MEDAECSLVDNLIAEKLILPTFRPDAPVLLRARVKLSRGTSQLINLSYMWHHASSENVNLGMSCCYCGKFLSLSPLCSRSSRRGLDLFYSQLTPQQQECLEPEFGMWDRGSKDQWLHQDWDLWRRGSSLWNGSSNYNICTAVQPSMGDLRNSNVTFKVWSFSASLHWNLVPPGDNILTGKILRRPPSPWLVLNGFSPLGTTVLLSANIQFTRLADLLEEMHRTSTTTFEAFPTVILSGSSRRSGSSVENTSSSLETVQIPETQPTVSGVVPSDSGAWFSLPHAFKVRSDNRDNTPVEPITLRNREKLHRVYIRRIASSACRRPASHIMHTMSMNSK